MLLIFSSSPFTPFGWIYQKVLIFLRVKKKLKIYDYLDDSTKFLNYYTRKDENRDALLRAFNNYSTFFINC